MDFNLIYSKSASGKEAMRERSLVAQRSMRMMLTLIDGKTTVADLCAKTGNVQLAEEALHALERGGFIEPLAGQNLLMAQSKDLEQEIKAAATEQTSEFSTFGNKYGPPPDPSGKLPQPQASALLSVPATRPGLLERLKTRLEEARFSAPQADVNIAPLRRKAGGTSRRWPIVVFLALFGLVAIAGLALMFFPLNYYLPDVEAALAQASGQSAKVSDIRISLYPKPGLFLSNVRLGDELDEKSVRMAELRLLPEVGSLLQPKKIFSHLYLSGVVLPVEAIAGFPRIFDALARPSSLFGVRQIFFDRTDLDLHRLSLPALMGEVKLTQDGRFESLVLHLPDRSLQIEAKPLLGALEVTLEGFGWRPSPDSAFIFDSLNLKGQLEGAVFSVNSMNLRLFDGLIHGLVRLHAGQQATVEGEIGFERINAKRFGVALGIGPQFEGEINGTLKFLAAADSWPAIFTQMRSEGQFSIGRGSLGGFDLTEAARRSSSSPVHGGITRFEQLQGNFKMTPENSVFSNLTLNSGLMQSVGQITVGKDLQLSGTMEVQMRGTVNQIHVPVLISGALSAPLLQIGKR